MMTNLGTNLYDLSSMESYGKVVQIEKNTAQDMDLVQESTSQVMGLQSMLRTHRREMLSQAV